MAGHCDAVPTSWAGNVKQAGLVLMARIGGAHGIKGELRVKAFGQDPMALGEYDQFHAKDGRIFRISRLRQSGKGLVVKFQGVDDREAAQALTDVDLFVERSALPDDLEADEFYVCDLVGCQVVDPGGQVLGIVNAVFNFGAGDIIEIGRKGSPQTILLEFSQANVPEYDLTKRQLTVVLPDEVSERDD